MTEAITLKVDGREWEGWEDVRIDTHFGKALCGRFSLTLADRWRNDFRARPITTGMRCEVWLGDELRSTGWVFKVGPGYGPHRHLIKVSGRDLTADLVDCSSTITPGAWTNRKLEDIARDLCAEFNISVVPGDDTGKPIAQARLQIGETPFQFLEKLCRSRATWCATTVKGELTFLKASRQRLPGVLERGWDAEDAEADYSDEGRHSVYIGMGQQRGSDTVGPEQAALVTARCPDESVTRHRPLIVQGEDQQNGETLFDRVINERNKRIGDSRSIKFTVAGWRMKDGTVWPVNRRVAVDDEWLGESSEYIIEQTSFEMSKKRDSTRLTLVPPEKFDIQYTGSKLQPAIESSTEDTSRPWDRVTGPI